jgi:hypothetical protein
VTVFLGGAASPVGWAVQYVHAPFDAVLGHLVRWRREPPLSQRLEVSDPQPFPQVLDAFVPFQSPWTRELVLPCGDWTAYLNNSIGGGDPSASIAVVARQLGVRWVMGMNTLRHGPGHQATQLWVCGPAGKPPQLYERTLAAYAADGRWGWSQSGDPFPFEDLDRYQARRKRDRFDRALLLRYLEALGIPADDDAYGDGVIVQQRADWHHERPPRVVTLAEARADFASRGAKHNDPRGSVVAVEPVTTLGSGR